MTPGERLKRSARTGALLGCAYFGSDALGAFLAIGELFDPKPESFILLSVAALFTVVAAMLIGVVFGFTLGRFLRLPTGTRKQRLFALGFAAIGVAATGYGVRVSRVTQHPQPQHITPAPKPLPVLWILVDTLRADSLYGDNFEFPHTPAIKQFATNAVVLSDAEAPAGWTLPSVATLMTGIHPTTLYSARGYLPNWAPTAAQRLKRAGYETHAWVDNYLLERRNGFASGFDSYFQKSALRFAFTFPGFRLIPTRLRESLREELAVFYYGAAGMTDVAIATIQESSRSAFFYVHYMDVHYPYYSHPEIAPDPHDAQPVQLHYAMAAARELGEQPSAAQMKFLEHRYHGELKALDPHIGRLLTAWDEQYGDESLVVLTSDHGEEFLEHGELGHGNSLYRELVHIPLLIRLPKSIRRAYPPPSLEGAIGLVDVLPTTLDILGIPSKPDTEFLGVQGESFLPWLIGKSAAPTRPVYATQNRHQRRIYRWRTNDHAYINHYDHRQKDKPVGHSELYLKSKDYAESENVFAAQPRLAKKMQASLSAFVSEQEKDRDPQPVTTEPNVEAMKALGYIQ